MSENRILQELFRYQTAYSVKNSTQIQQFGRYIRLQKFRSSSKANTISSLKICLLLLLPEKFGQIYFSGTLAARSNKYPALNLHARVTQACTSRRLVIFEKAKSRQLIFITQRSLLCMSNTPFLLYKNVRRIYIALPQVYHQYSPAVIYTPRSIPPNIYCNKNQSELRSSRVISSNVVAK